MIGLLLASLLSSAIRRLRGTSVTIGADWFLYVFLGVRFVALAAVVLLAPVVVVAIAASLESSTMLIRAVIFVLVSGTLAIMASGIAFNVALTIRGLGPSEA